MKTFLKILGYTLFSVLAVAFAHNFLSPDHLKVWQEIVSWLSIPGFIVVGWSWNDWWRQNMTLTYIKSSDAGMLYVKNVRKQKEKLYIRSEPVAPGITFNYDRDTGELWSIHVRGTNNVKTEEDEK
jgi:hypothetical protein